MSLLENTTLRGVAYVALVIVWAVALFFMGLLVFTGFDVAMAPPHENKLVGVVWILLGPAIPVGLLAAAGLIWWGWNHMVAAHRPLARAAAYSIPVAAVGFLAGFVGIFQMWGAIAMATTLAFHVVATVGALGATAADDRLPWLS